MVPSPVAKLTRGALTPGLCLLLICGCNAPPPPAPPPDALRIGPVPTPWTAAALQPGPDGRVWIAANSHEQNFLGVWAVDPRRQVQLIGTYPEVGFHPDAARWVDLEGDGHPELLVAAEGKTELQLWRIKASGGGLELAAKTSAGNPPLDVLAADLDGDGHTDLVTSPYQGPSLGFFWGQGGFEFTTTWLPPFEKGKEQVDRPAPAKAEQHPLVAGGGGVPAVVGYLQQHGKPAPRLWAGQARVADWDGDGLPDILWSDIQGGAILFAKNLGGRAFEMRQLRPPAEGNPRQVALADLDGDGALDLIAVLETGGKALVLYNDGRGGVRDTEEIPAPRWGYSNVTAVGAPSPLLVLTEDQMVILARREGNGWRLRQLPTGSFPLDPHLIDLDGDGHLDLLVAHAGGDDVGITYGPLWERAQELKK